MPRRNSDPTLPRDPAERKRELTRRRAARLRERRGGVDPVPGLARDLMRKLDRDQLRRLAELLTEV